MDKTNIINEIEIKNDWSAVMDSVIGDKPRFIKRTRDYMFLSDIKIIESMLEGYKFTAAEYTEDDGSITLSLNEMDLAENGKDKETAVYNLAKDILEYAKDYYDDFQKWSMGDRKLHIPYIFKALIIGDIEKIGKLIECYPGEDEE